MKQVQFANLKEELFQKYELPLFRNRQFQVNQPKNGNPDYATCANCGKRIEKIILPVYGPGWTHCMNQTKTCTNPTVL